MKLIVGLGNPGMEYEKTKHNVGFMFIDNLATKLGVSISKNKFDGEYQETKINGCKVILLKPMKFINLSGEVIKKYVEYYKIDISDILIISDDLDTEIGKYKFKANGSSGGHNGLKNIEYNLKTKEYKRFKIGISNNKSIDAKDYVLSKINDDNMKIYDKIFDMSLDIVSDFIKLDFNLVMNKYNSRGKND